MSKKLRITRKGKTVIAITAAVGLILSGITAVALWNRSEPDNYTDEVYSYSIGVILSQSKENESKARQELREKIEKANSLLKDTDGRIFDSSRTNLETYITNIKDIPDSQIVESDNFIDYVNSEKRVESFIDNLSEKQEALQTSYDKWLETRTEQDKNANEINEEVNSGITNADELEKTIQKNIQEAERIQEEREQQRRELEEKNKRQNQDTAQQPTAPSPSLPASPATPPAPTPTTSPSPTSTPAPTPTEKPSTMPSIPTSPVEEDNEDAQNSMIGQDNG